MLRLENVQVRYGQVLALRGLNMDVEAGEIVALIGANGAGKSTALKAVSGLIPVWQGTIALNGKPLAGLQPEDLVEMGIVHVPEGRRIFPRLTVEENLKMGAYPRRARAASGIPAAQVFIEKFKKAYGTVPNAFNAEAYDAMTIALLAIEKAGREDKAAIRDALAGVSFECVRGSFKFDSKGDPLLLTHVVKIENGQETNGRDISVQR
jgi:ABC-type sugar transport system ATPase subunit